MQINKNWVDAGYLMIDTDHYLDPSASDSLKAVNHLYETALRSDGPRNRAYLKLEWSRENSQIVVAENQNYFQTAANNSADGGKIRQFAQMDVDIIKLPILKNILQKNLNIIEQYEPLAQYDRMTLGLHFIQYVAQEGEASYSSPVGLHLDDEPLVFVHLLELSEDALGGDNLIAEFSDQEIKKVIRLEKPMDTLLVNRNCYHAVTPLGSRKGVAKRNIILFTIEPEDTQIITH
ncbi:MAG: 2OG-Fe dioxygenase family protein [Gammaproteobacteria bacterium]|nr:2OG-Fe dioxygenase family protein [Gammaproteobacteria bacterium]